MILSIPGAHGSPEATGVVGGSHLPNSDTLRLAGFSTVKKIQKENMNIYPEMFAAT